MPLDEPITNHMTNIKFRHLLEVNHWERKIFDTIDQWLERPGVLVKEGSSIDATIIEAPSASKNKLKQRDPNMHQIKKANQ